MPRQCSRKQQDRLDIMENVSARQGRGFWRSLLIVSGILLSGLLVVAGIYREELIRVYQVIVLFEPDRITDNFRSMDRIFHTSTVKHGRTVQRLPYLTRALPTTYTYKGTRRDLRSFLDDTWTTGMVVIHDGAIAYEHYFRGNTDKTRTISWSVAKSFISALVGIAVSEGHVAGITDPVTRYVPFLEGTGYANVPIKDILQMSSGVRFNEDYADFFSDINRMGRAFALNTSLDNFVASLENERPPGTYNHYVSMDTQVLGMLLRESTGQSVTTYLQEKIWQPLGMESDAYWIVDGNGMEVAFGGLNAVLRDYARFGLLYLNNGVYDGKQIVPADWIRASVTPDAPHLQPGRNPASSWVLGYGYQWWIPERPEGDFLAIGVYNQFIYVHPTYRVVIAKSSAYPGYNEDGDEKELESIAMFRAIARHVSAAGGSGG